jgi:hypothetical protein
VGPAQSVAVGRRCVYSVGPLFSDQSRVVREGACDRHERLVNGREGERETDLDIQSLYIYGYGGLRLGVTIIYLCAVYLSVGDTWHHRDAPLVIALRNLDVRAFCAGTHSHSSSNPLSLRRGGAMEL